MTLGLAGKEKGNEDGGNWGTICGRALFRVATLSKSVSMASRRTGGFPTPKILSFATTIGLVAGWMGGLPAVTRVTIAFPILTGLVNGATRSPIWMPALAASSVHLPGFVLHPNTSSGVPLISKKSAAGVGSTFCAMARVPPASVSTTPSATHPTPSIGFWTRLFHK